ncbi:MAG: CapA family protein [Halobacteriota archaeon]
MKVEADTKTEEGAITAPNCKVTPVKFKKIASPYDRKETWGLIVRHIFGIDTRRNRGIAEYLPHKIVLNEKVASKQKIGVVGDIMDMMGCRWIHGEELKEFFRQCDCLIGNFEATVVKPVQKQPKGVIFNFVQRHDENIVSSLRNLFDPKKTYLSLANNHAGDFGQLAFERSVHLLMQNGFHVFGLTDTPFIDVNKCIRIVTGTRWSNQICDYVFSLNSFDESLDFIDQGRFNILYPHWSYELELYPRPETIEQGKRYIEKFDAIIGHHSHVPQPLIRAHHDAANTIIAYGLGDICTRKKYKKYHYGIALKFDVGLNEREEWVIGELEWSFTECHQISKTAYQTNLVENLPYLPHSAKEIHKTSEV